jgi:predicted RecA/RadA family phage recombinase
MIARFIHEGKSIDYTPAADVTAGDVIVQGELVGVAQVDIPANQLGALLVAGVCDFPKVTGAGTAIEAGVEVFWDVADAEAKANSELGTNPLIGKCVMAAADADTTVRVRLSQ